MSDFLQRDLPEMAEERRELLPPNLLRFCDVAERELREGRWPIPMRFHGVDEDNTSAKLVEIALEELHLLLCTDDEKYADVRQKGREFSRSALTAISFYIAGALGVQVALATAAVAFVALLAFRVGTSLFCRAHENSE